MKRFLLALTALLGVALLATALGPLSRRKPPSSGRLPRIVGSSFPVRIVSAEGSELELASPPQRLLPANAAWVDFVSLLLGPERVSALPATARDYSRLSDPAGGWAGLPRFTGFRAETLLAFRPDLVLAHSWQDPETLATLRREGVSVLVVPVPQSWEEIEETSLLLGAALGERQRAGELARERARRRAALRARATGFRGLRALSYTNLGGGGWTAGARTTVDVLLGLTGLRNAAAEIGIEGEAPLELEQIVTLDPDLFVVALPAGIAGSPPSAGVLLAEPALTGLAAIRAGRIAALPSRLFSTASPELLIGAERLAAEVELLFGGLPAPASDGAARGEPPGGG